MHLDGWVVRFASGYTKRASSVYPLYFAEQDIDGNINFCQTFYRDKSLPTIFKMTEACAPAKLDFALNARGYQKDSQTSVQFLDIRNTEHEIDSAIELSDKDTKDWHKAFRHMNGISVENGAIHKSITQGILPANCYAAIAKDDNFIGCGLGVFQSGFIGIYDVIIDSDYRGQGNGRCLMEVLLAWGQKQGAHTAYLQVLRNNKAALQLYKSLRFRKAYQYWYRIKFEATIDI